MLSIPRLPGPASLQWRVPGSKSITNRALVLAALAEGTSVIEGALESDDTRWMREGLGALGIAIESAGTERLLVHGGRRHLRPPAQPLFVGNSGTTVRFLAALAALVPGPVTLVGDAAMARRPIADLVAALTQLGLRVDCASGCPPLTIHGGRLAGGRVRLRGDRSSQYLSALLMAGAFAEQELEIVIEGELVSRPFVAMTCRMVSDFGGRIEETGEGFRVRRSAAYRPLVYRVEPDATAASYPFALAAGGHQVTVPDLGARSLQGDYAFLEVLERMGARVERAPQRTRVQGGPLRGVDADLHDISDTVMTLAALAPLAEGVTCIRRVGNIRIKECDRLRALSEALGALGQGVDEGPDWLRIEPRPLRPALIRCHGDHRMAMAFGILGALSGAVTVDDPACVAKTYPGFWRDLARCYPEPWAP
ncbi:MAG: 3-phosphoshikimate 1-carboxyvinyltransferase [Planctomycetota bacterium]|nr:3-phosphoshikimate 1-carboxyvinyltransferase [Planctomycetota bacterium]MCX8040465.1 3-phosphoshikimate 1-carboxyvinyltransferase [Planctomycetota bacterium]MDW8373213.1 3-phosphoshikimate 1-carboxyvinyltransferase [Planctomycetota bacterium]